MPRSTAWTDEYTLLCERCGYVLEGIGAEQCPECGESVARSRPEAREGTAWQKRLGFGSWLRVNWQVLWSPRRTFRAIAITETRRVWLLLIVNLVMATVVCGAMWVWVSSDKGAATTSYKIGFVNAPTPPPIQSWQSPVTSPVSLVSVGLYSFPIPNVLSVAIKCALALPLVLLLLTRIESLGVRFFGRQRGWRITKPIAWNVCCHASIGWTIGCVLHALTPLGLIWGGALLDLLPANAAIRVAVEYARWSPIAAFFVGMLIFETLVYVGIRQCRFANVPRV